MRYSVDTVKKLLQEAKRFSCDTFYFFDHEDLKNIGKKIIERIEDSKCLISVETSGTEFYNRYIVPNIRRYHRHISINPKTQQINGDITYLGCQDKIIIVDDVVDSGETLKQVFQILSKFIKVNNIYFEIYTVVSSRHVNKIENISYYINKFYIREDNEYVVFPWEIENIGNNSEKQKFVEVK